MDIIDRLGNLIRTILDDDEPARTGFRSTDPDEVAAWEELEAYMQGEARSTSTTAARPRVHGVPESLQRDFRNLEVPVGAPLPEVRKAYKRLMASFHPDRHSSDPDRLRTATEVTKKLNHSFQRIRAYYEGGE